MDAKKEQMITEEYLSSLADLNVNSKPLINMLTMLADENIEYAPGIVRAVEQHLAKVTPEIKLPILYLIDSIVKNVGKQYKTLFNQSIVNIFCSVFEKVNEKVREKMYNLRQTWNEVFPQTKLYALDVKVNLMDNNWPVTAKVVSSAAKTPKIHVNPNFLHKQALPVTNSDVQNQLKQQEMELLALQARKLELELQATKQKLEAAQNNNTEQVRTDTVRIVVGDKVINKQRPMMMQPGQMQQMPPTTSGQNRQRIASVNAAMISNIKSRDPRLQRQQQISQQNHQNQINHQNHQAQNHQQPNEHMMQNNLPPKFFPHQQQQRHMQQPPRGPQQPHFNNMYPNQGQPVKALPKIPKYSQNASQSTSQAPKSSTATSRSPSSHRERERKSRDESTSKSSKKESKSPHKSSSDESKSPRKKRSEDSKESKDKDKKTSKSPKRSSTKTSSSTSKDVDLRVLPGDLPKKTSRIDNNKMLNKLLLEAQESQEAGSNELGSDATKQDIDLRLLVTETKKRASTDHQLEEPMSKKSRAEKLDDQLFGSEDVDLRSLGVAAIGFSSPPPPIEGTLIKNLEAKVKNASPEAPGRSDKVKKSNFEAVRAKLAEASKKSRDKATSLLIDNEQDPVIERKRKLSESLNKKLLSLNVDQRGDMAQELDDESPGFNKHVQNFIRQAKEQMESGNMDEDQYNLLVKQLLEVNESRKKLQNNDVVEVSEDDSDTSQKSQPSGSKRVKTETSNSNNISEFTHATASDLRNSSNFVKEKRNGKDTKWSPAPVWPSGQPQIQPRNVNPWEQNPFQPSVLPPTNQPPPVEVVQPQNSSALVFNNKLRTVRLDGNKDHILKFYEDTAIIFDEFGQPHDIKFSAGQSMVIFDDVYQTPLHFHATNPQPIQIEGNMHMIKFGTPTRELYIDNNYYECYFNNQPTHILLDGKVRIVRIDGRVPEVKIGRKRMDLVLGKINLIIDAKLVIPVFLDIKMQYFELEAKIHTLQFADFFSTVIINNEPTQVEFGGLPKNFNLYGKKHFLRFTALPDNLEPGKININGLKRTALSRDIIVPPLLEFAVTDPAPNDLDIGMLVENDIQANRDDLPHLLATMPPMSTIPQLPNMSVMPPMTNLTQFVSSSEPQNIPGFGNDSSTSGAPALLNLNINDLFQKLVATGILGSNDENQKQKMGNNPRRDNNRKKDPPVTERRFKISPILFSKMETIKTRQQGLVDLIYSGMQCSSCGARFPPEQTIKYSQHLDWHFRQNRRERDSQRRAHSRKWYYDCADWIRYEEIEDIEEREKNFFETQQEAQQDNGGDSAQGRLDVSIDSSVAPSCAAGRDSFSHNCALCTDPFEQFFNNKTEEWHLRMAMKVDDKFYHPICHDEFKASLLLDESHHNTSIDLKEESDSLDTKDIKVKSEKTEPESEPYEDDDDVMILPNEAPIVTEILDDEDQIKAEPEATTSEPVEEPELNNITIDDDVMIQEPKIITENLVESDDEEIRDADESSQSAFIFKIKEEPKDEDEDNDEDNFMDVATIDNDFMNDENYTNSPRPTSNSAPTEHDINDNAMMQSEEDSREESPPPVEPSQLDQQLINCDSSECSQPAAAPSVPNKIKIVLSSLAQQNLTSRSSNSNNVITDSDSLEKNKLEQNGVIVDEVIKVKPYEMPAIEYELKTHLRDVKFDKITIPHRRGVENSGLCSIM